MHELYLRVSTKEARQQIVDWLIVQTGPMVTETDRPAPTVFMSNDDCTCKIYCGFNFDMIVVRLKDLSLATMCKMLYTDYAV